jgi:hypothetical protein
MAQSPSSVVVIRSQGVTRVEWKLQIFAVVYFGFMYLLLYFGTVGGPSHGFVPPLVGAAAASILLDCIFLEIVSHPRELELSPEGIKFRYRLHSEHCSWKDPHSTIQVGFGDFGEGGWSVSRPYRLTTAGRTRNRGHWLTETQLRAFVSYPSGRTWKITDSLMRRVTAAREARRHSRNAGGNLRPQ